MKVVHMTRVLAIIGAIAVVLVVTASAVGASYNRLVTLDQAVQSQWAQVESSYQRRADLIPNVVEIVKGVTNFEKSTSIAVAEARAKAGQVNVVGSSAPTSPELRSPWRDAGGIDEGEGARGDRRFGSA
jgi:hypothetical protein